MEKLIERLQGLEKIDKTNNFDRAKPLNPSKIYKKEKRIPLVIT